MSQKENKMIYNHLGNTGLRVSKSDSVVWCRPSRQ